MTRQPGMSLLTVGLLALLGLVWTGVVAAASPASYQGLTEQERQDFYHLSTGAQLLPYDWFVALEQGGSSQPLLSLLPAVGLVADPSNPKGNPDGLAVGLAKTEGAKGAPDQLGVSCAFCHTHLLTYQGKSIRIEGGTTFQYNSKFVDAMIGAMKATLDDQEKFSRFAKTVLLKSNKADDAAGREKLRKDVARHHKALLFRSSRDVAPVTWGFGRNDGLGRGGSLVFSQLNPDNLRPANAPMSIPYLWGSWEYDWLQWNGSIQNPMSRSIGQVIGVGAGLFTRPTEGDPAAPYVDPKDPFASSVNLDNLKTLQKLVKKLRPPRWPAAFPAINPDLAAKGRELYHGNVAKKIKNLCAHCHVPEPLQASERPTGDQQLHVAMIPVDEIGTDPLAARNFVSRTAETGALGKGRLAAKDAIQLITTEIMQHGGVDAGANRVRAEEKYMARPQAGLWATPPFLHNGSVPNVYELLSPIEERTPCFYIGPVNEYDPVKLGLTARPCESGAMNAEPEFKFDTNRAGNWNIGHEFRGKSGTCASPNAKDRPGVLGCEIPSEDRRAIIEYLKTCDLERPQWKEAVPCRDLEVPARTASPHRTVPTVTR